MDRHIDVVILEDDASDAELVQQMLRAPGIKLMNFSQAEAYARRFPWLLGG